MNWNLRVTLVIKHVFLLMFIKPLSSDDTEANENDRENLMSMSSARPAPAYYVLVHFFAVLIMSLINHVNYGV